jgi:hypothetical protein
MKFALPMLRFKFALPTMGSTVLITGDASRFSAA